MMNWNQVVWGTALAACVTLFPGGAPCAPAAAGAKQFWQKGSEYAANKLYIDAVEYYTRAIRTNKGEISIEDVARIFNSRGLAYLNLNEPDKAIDDFSNGLELDEKNPEIWINRGTVFASRKQYERAQEDFTRVIALLPRSTAAYSGRGYAFLDAGITARALADFTKLLEIEPRNTGALFGRGLAYKSLRQDEKAIAAFNDLLAIDPRHAGAAYHSAGIYSRAGKIDAACAWLDTAVADGYRDWSALKNDPDFDALRKVDCYRKVMSGK